MARTKAECPLDPDSTTPYLDQIYCMTGGDPRKPSVPASPSVAPYDAPPADTSAGEAWSFLGIGVGGWGLIIILALIALWWMGRRARHREELTRRDALRDRYADIAAPESNLGDRYAEAPRHEHPSPRGRAPDDDDWEEL